MRQVPSYPLWLGHAGDGRDVRQILDAGIKAVVQLAIDEPAPQLTRDLLFFRFPLVDGSDNHYHVVLLALGSVAHLLKMRLPTLLCCGHGMSRTPAVAAGAIAILEGIDPDDSLKRITTGYPADVTPGLWMDVKQQCRQLAGLRS
jgi:hypothetical protein